MLRVLSIVLATVLIQSYCEYTEFDEVEEDEQENVLWPWIQKHQEPTGVTCVAYVDEDSPNHKLIKKLGLFLNSTQQKVPERDQGFANMKLSVAAAMWWREKGNESLILRYRTPFPMLWRMLELPPMDVEEKIFVSKKKKWKEADVKKWIMEEAWPTVNIRILDKNRSPFPFDKYLSRANSGGVAFIVANLTDENEVKQQLQVTRVLRQHAERLRGKVRFTFLERTKETREIRADLGVGLDSRLNAEMVLIEDVAGLSPPDDQAKLNYWHGSPKKYYLNNFTQEAVDQFFLDLKKGKLPSHWVSKEPWTWGAAPAPSPGPLKHLTGATFDKFVFDEDPKKIRLVAFFDNASYCIECGPRERETWERVAKHVERHRGLAKKVSLAMLDQSVNEHPESLVPGKIAQPMLVWYPAGSRAQRERNRRKVEQFSAAFEYDNIIENLEDALDRAEDPDEEL